MRIYTSYLNAAGNGTASQDLWYRYDAVNRMVVAKGSLASGVITGGAAFGYDAAGNRVAQISGGTNYAYTYTMDGYPPLFSSTRRAGALRGACFGLTPSSCIGTGK